MCRQPQPVGWLVTNPADWRRSTAFSCRSTGKIGGSKTGIKQMAIMGYTSDIERLTLPDK